MCLYLKDTVLLTSPKSSRPIWTNELWNYMQNKLDKGNDGGPPGYRNSGKSVMKGVTWALENILTSCGVGDAPCHMSVFSAISPWAEAIIFWSATKKLSRHNTRLTSVDFNPCILDGIPPNIIAECKSTLDLVKKPGSSFDLTVSYSGIEHDGLGRYGDPVNPDGDISALREMRLLTSPGGILLVREAICLNYVLLMVANLLLISWQFHVLIASSSQKQAYPYVSLMFIYLFMNHEGLSNILKQGEMERFRCYNIVLMVPSDICGCLLGGFWRDLL